MKKNITSIWQFISSNVFAVSILGILALFSVIGTVIPQRENPDVYARLYGEVFSQFFYNLGFFDFFNSPVFLIILSLLGLSLFACSFNRLATLLNDKLNFYHWGSFAAHLSVLIIYLGAIYGQNAGFSSYVQIEKGEIFLEPHGGFSVRLNDFNATFDQNQRPLTYTSDLTVIDNNKEILNKVISVNNPLVYKGIKFYQSSYGLKGELEISGPDGKSQRLPITVGGCAVYSATGQMFHVAEMIPDLKIIHNLTLDKYEPTRPVVLIEGNGYLLQGQVRKAGAYSLKLLAVKEFTGLQVKRDPGVPIVYFGFCLLTVGTAIMLLKRNNNS
ncbi:cytochrome c biogenesis protein ResB [Candidatus Saganbacteria bacterium]|nr:cytochrome c biogenesis protein ResB [Candidatus Saganbacteria bacterium]